MGKGKLVTVTGIPGAGKSFMIKHLLKSDLGFEYLLSATTRNKREHEINGVDAYFMNVNEFLYLEHNNEFETVDNIFGNYYGIFKNDIQKLDKAINLIKEFVFRNPGDIKSVFPYKFSTYILPINLKVAIEELGKRQTPEEEKRNRLDYIFSQWAWIKKDENKQAFDAVHINNYDEQSVVSFRNLIKKEIEKVM